MPFLGYAQGDCLAPESFSKVHETVFDDQVDVLIVGGGIAGLSSAIFLAEQGIKRILVLEKGDKIAPLPRGETTEYDPVLDRVLGQGFIASISQNRYSEQRFSSPGDKKHFVMHYNKMPGYVFKWRDLADQLEKRAKSLGVEIRLNAEVPETFEDPGLSPFIHYSDPLTGDSICEGVRYKEKTGKVRSVEANIILGCDGHGSVTGKYYLGQNFYKKMNCPTIKCLFSNARMDTVQLSQLQLYMIGRGNLLELCENQELLNAALSEGLTKEDLSAFPQCVAFLFPKGGREMEAGLMLRTMLISEVPSEEIIKKVWNFLKKAYPGFSEVFMGVKKEDIHTEHLTQIPVADLAENISPAKGIILLGDSIGLLTSSSSGILSSMLFAEETSRVLSTELKKCYQSDPSINSSFSHYWGLWNEANHERFKKTLLSSPVYKKIRFQFSLTRIAETVVFEYLKTARNINRWFGFMGILFNIDSCFRHFLQGTAKPVIQKVKTSLFQKSA